MIMHLFTHSILQSYIAIFIPQISDFKSLINVIFTL